MNVQLKQVLEHPLHNLNEATLSNVCDILDVLLIYYQASYATSLRRYGRLKLVKFLFRAVIAP